MCDRDRCLQALGELTAGGEFFVPFAPICVETNLGRAEVRRHIRALSADGLAEYSRGLMDEDGKCRGAGYSITKIGVNCLDAKTRRALSDV